MNPLISICIPTYNRELLLREGLVRLISQIRRYSIPIYISDNASEDNTERMVMKLKVDYEYIFYKKNEINLGLDRNVECVLKMSTTKYSWLLGDDDRIVTEAIALVLDAIQTNRYALVVVNGGSKPMNFGRVRSIESREYSDKSELLSELGWHMTWLSTLIFDTEQAKSMIFSDYYGTYFGHIGAIFSHFPMKPGAKVYWLKECVIYFSEGSAFSWGSTVFEVFGRSWADVVMQLPVNYDEASKLACVKNHGLKSGLFTTMGFLSLRSKGIYTLDSYKKHKAYFSLITDVPNYLLFLISILPITLLFRISQPLKKFRKRYLNIFI
jgi:abequosyltransferase